MHRFETVFLALVTQRHDRVEPLQFFLEVFVHEHKRLKRPPHVAIARCYDFFDSNFSPLVRHW